MRALVLLPALALLLTAALPVQAQQPDRKQMRKQCERAVAQEFDRPRGQVGTEAPAKAGGGWRVEARSPKKRADAHATCVFGDDGALRNVRVTQRPPAGGGNRQGGDRQAGGRQGGQGGGGGGGGGATAQVDTSALVAECRRTAVTLMSARDADLRMGRVQRSGNGWQLDGNHTLRAGAGDFRCVFDSSGRLSNFLKGSQASGGGQGGGQTTPDRVDQARLRADCGERARRQWNVDAGAVEVDAARYAADRWRVDGRRRAIGGARGFQCVYGRDGRFAEIRDLGGVSGGQTGGAGGVDQDRLRADCGERARRQWNLDAGAVEVDAARYAADRWRVDGRRRAIGGARGFQCVYGRDGQFAEIVDRGVISGSQTGGVGGVDQARLSSDCAQEARRRYNLSTRDVEVGRARFADERWRVNGRRAALGGARDFQCVFGREGRFLEIQDGLGW